MSGASLLQSLLRSAAAGGSGVAGGGGAQSPPPPSSRRSAAAAAAGVPLAGRTELDAAAIGACDMQLTGFTSGAQPTPPPPAPSPGSLFASSAAFRAYQSGSAAMVRVVAQADSNVRPIVRHAASAAAADMSDVCLLYTSPSPRD